jgi:membrane-associated phospholipid phosphatase
MTRVLKIWLMSLVLTVAAVWVSYQWLDRPIALGIRDSFGGMRVPTKLIESPLSSTSSISALAFVICGFMAISGRRFSTLSTTVTMCVLSTITAILIKDQLKPLFGRTWPDTWAPGILSLVRDGVYGFHYFRYGHSFESFPSGHAAVATAVLSVPWFLFPRLRVGAAICTIAIDMGLVMLNLHFLSDVIAGTFIGFSTGLFTIYLWRATEPHLVTHNSQSEVPRSYVRHSSHH